MVRVTSLTFFLIATVPVPCSAARMSMETDSADDNTQNDEFWGRRRRRTDHMSDGSYVDIDEPAHFNCGSEYTLGGLGADRLPDLITSAHEWCRSDLVPSHKRVPEFLRGLYWMKDLFLSDVAFCGSLGEWDAETLTARLPVWSTFVVGKTPEEEVPRLIRDISGQGNSPRALILGRHALIYSIAFTNSSFTEAQISPSHRLFDIISNFPMIALSSTKDGALSSEHPGDIFDRPSFIFGQSGGDAYEAVKVMYDDGTLNMERVSLMRSMRSADNMTYMRYAPSC